MNDEHKYSSYPSTEEEKELYQDQINEDKIASLNDKLDYISKSVSLDTDDEFNLTKNLPFQDTANFQKISNLNSAFNDSSSEDPLEKTGDISSINSSQLEYYKALRQIFNEEEALEKDESSPAKGRQLVKRGPGAPIPSSEEKSIGEEFINHFVLAFVTAAIGTGWLINLVMRLM